MPKRVTLRWLFVMMVMIVLAACQNDNGGSDAADTPIPTSASVNDDTPITAPDPVINSARPTLPPSFDVNSTGSDSSESAANANAGLRVVHAMEGVPAIDILLDESVIYRTVAPNNVTLDTNWAEGEYTLTLSQSTAGRVRTGNETVYYSGNIRLEADTALLFLFTGSLDDIVVQVVEEDLTALEPDQARLTVVNALVDVESLEVQTEREALTEAVPFGEQSTPIVSPPRPYVLDFFNDTTLVITENITLKNGASHLLIVVGTTNNARVIRIESATPPQTRFRVVHAAPDTIPLQVRLNDVVVAERLTFGEFSDFALLPSGMYLAEIYLIGLDGVVDETPVQIRNIRLDNFATVELAVFGPDVELEIDTFSIDTRPIQVGESRVMFVHVGYDQGRLRGQSLSGEDMGVNLNYGNAQTITFTPSRQNIFFIGPSGTDSLEQIRDFTLAPATAYTYFITARQNQDPLIATIDVIEQGEAFETTISTATISNTRVSVYNGWTETIAVNFNGQRIVLGLPPSTLSEAVIFEPISTLIEILNTDGNLLFEKTVFLEENGPSNYRLYVVPNGASIELILMPDVVTPVESGFARIQFVHALPAYDQLAIVWNDDQLVQMFLGSLTEPYLVTPGRITFEIIDRAQSVLLFSQEIDAQVGTNYRLVVTETEAGTPTLIVLEN